MVVANVRHSRRRTWLSVRRTQVTIVALLHVKSGNTLVQHLHRVILPKGADSYWLLGCSADALPDGAGSGGGLSVTVRR